ncbi:MAG: phosphotransferase [Pseudomonadota bacterium]
MTDTVERGALPQALRAAFGIPAHAPSAPLSGGRTNRVWRVALEAGDVALKEFAAGADAPLFPNSYSDEVMSLARWGRSGLAPRLIAHRPEHLAIMTTFVDGSTPCRDPQALARALRQLHGAGPAGAVRNRPTSIAQVLGEGDRIARQVQGARRLEELRPTLEDLPLGPLVPLHGDPVPGNVVLQDGTAVLIDWQCPGIGPALEDIALALSPAMWLTNGEAPLTVAECTRFFTAYEDDTIDRLYRRAAPAYHWRMLCHCQWRVEQGFAEFEPALKREAEALQASLAGA